MAQSQQTRYKPVKFGIVSVYARVAGENFCCRKQNKVIVTIDIKRVAPRTRCQLSSVSVPCDRMNPTRCQDECMNLLFPRCVPSVTKDEVFPPAGSKKQHGQGGADGYHDPFVCCSAAVCGASDDECCQKPQGAGRQNICRRIFSGSNGIAKGSCMLNVDAAGGKFVTATVNVDAAAVGGNVT